MMLEKENILIVGMRSLKKWIEILELRVVSEVLIVVNEVFCELLMMVMIYSQSGGHLARSLYMLAMPPRITKIPTSSLSSREIPNTGPPYSYSASRLQPRGKSHIRMTSVTVVGK